MKTVGIVPVKSFARAKSRLGSVLRDDERAQLTRALFLHVLSVARESGVLDRIVVATDGDEVSTLALAHGADVLRDPQRVGSVPLGEVIDAAIDHVAADADAVLVLMSDLPLLTVADVTAMVDALSGADLVLAPDHREEGTNALVVRTARLGGATHTAFGHADSFARHCAIDPGASIAVHRTPGLGFDVDTANDWRSLTGGDDEAVRNTYRR